MGGAQRALFGDASWRMKASAIPDSRGARPYHCDIMPLQARDACNDWEHVPRLELGLGDVIRTEGEGRGTSLWPLSPCVAQEVVDSNALPKGGLLQQFLPLGGALICGEQRGGENGADLIGVLVERYRAGKSLRMPETWIGSLTPNEAFHKMGANGVAWRISEETNGERIRGPDQRAG